MDALPQGRAWAAIRCSSGPRFVFCRTVPTISPNPAAGPVLQALSMGGVQLSLRATADKMGRVLSEPSRRRQVYWAGCAAVLLFFLYLLMRR